MKRKSVRDVVENPKPESEYYVLVTRRYPTEFRFRKLKLSETPIDEWDRDLAPSPELLSDYKNGRITWEEYEKRFREEKPLTLVKRKTTIYREEAKGKEIVLVCEEEDSEYPKCHTWILLDQEMK